MFVRMDGASAGSVGLSEKAAIQSRYWANTNITSADTKSGSSYFNVQLSAAVTAIIDNYSFLIKTAQRDLYGGLYCNLDADVSNINLVIAAIEEPVVDCSISDAQFQSIESISKSAVGSVVTLFEALEIWDAIDSNTSSVPVSTAIVDTTGTIKFMFRPDQTAYVRFLIV